MPLFDALALKAASKAIIAATGSSDDEAEVVANHLVTANLKGHDSHGVGMIPRYISNFKAGLVRPNTAVEKTLDLGAILKFDGNKGYGQKTARDATEIALDRVGETGLCLYTLSNAHHIGRVGEYGEMAADRGYIGLFFVNVADHAPSVAPFGGGQARLLTNPVCIAIPRAEGGESLVLDMATASVALGKVRVAANKGEQMDEGLLLDPAGNPTTDPTVLIPELLGAITPMGDHKGYGLALMAEILAGILSGGKTLHPGTRREEGIINNLFGIVFDPGKLVDKEHYDYELSSTVDYVRSSRPIDQDNPVMVAGDPERKFVKSRMARGVEIDEKTWSDIVAAADGLDVPISIESLS